MAFTAIPAAQEWIVIFIVLGLIIAAIKSGRTGRWVLGLTALTGLFGVLILGLFMFTAYPVSVEKSETRHYPQTTQPASPQLVNTETQRMFEGVIEQQTKIQAETDLAIASRPAAETHFEADIYPSAQSAAVALVGRLLQSPGPLETVLDNDQVIECFRIEGNVDGNILGQVAEVARKRFPSAGIEMADSNKKSLPPPNKTLLTILVENMHSKPSGNTIRVTMEGPTGVKNSRTKRWVDKPWVENPVGYAAKQPSKNYFVAHCPQLATDQQEAIDLAIAEAAKKIEPLVRDYLNIRDRPWESQYKSAEQEELTKKIANQLQLGYYGTNYVEDRFVQGFDRPYGQVWSGAVLVSATPIQIICLSKEIQKSMRLRTTSALSMAGLVLLIIVVYIFLNAATKGYYVWSLRIAVGVLLLASILVVLTVV